MSACPWGLLGLVSAPIALVIYLNGYRDLLDITEAEK